MTQTYYNEISKSYDELHKQEQLNKLKIIKNNLKLDRKKLLLDVGCGSGISSDFNCKVVGVDPSFGLLKIAKINYSAKYFINAIAEKLPFKDNCFDIVISVTALHNFNNIKKGLNEIKRVGRNKFVLSVFKKSKKLNYINKLIKQNFKINKIIKEDKDIIYFSRGEKNV